MVVKLKGVSDMAFIGTTNEWNQFSQDVQEGFNEKKDNRTGTVKDYCWKCDKETDGWEDTWMDPVDGEQCDFNCYKCEDELQGGK